MMDLRPNKNARFMMQAELESMWSTCQRLQVGTEVTDDAGSILLTARNGVPRKQVHCNELETIDGRCIKCVHSETNLINHAARLGICLRGKNVTTLYRPCITCANNLVQTDINSLYFRHHYDSDGQRDYVLNLLVSCGVFVLQLKMTAEEIAFSNMLKAWKETWNSGSQNIQLVSKLTGL